MNVTQKFACAAAALLTSYASAASQGDIDLATGAAADTRYKLALAAACGVPVTKSPNPRLERFAAALEIGRKELRQKLSPQEFEQVMQSASSAEMASSIDKRVADGVASGACKDADNIEFWDFLREASRAVN